MTWKSQATKEKIGKLDFIKIKNFCDSKDTSEESEKTIHRMGKIYPNRISDKGLVPRIYKKIL